MREIFIFEKYYPSSNMIMGAHLVLLYHRQYYDSYCLDFHHNLDAHQDPARNLNLLVIINYIQIGF